LDKNTAFGELKVEKVGKTEIEAEPFDFRLFPGKRLRIIQKPWGKIVTGLYLRWVVA